MPKHKKGFKQKVSEFTYNRPSMDKHFGKIQKGMSEVSSLLNDKKKK